MTKFTNDAVSLKFSCLIVFIIQNQILYVNFNVIEKMDYVMHLSSVVTKECLEIKQNGKNVWIVIENVLGRIGI